MGIYDAPPEEVFNQIKQAAIDIWSHYDNTYGYVDEKLGTINRLRNYRENWGTIVGMFDSTNQSKLIALLLQRQHKEAADKVMEWL